MVYGFSFLIRNFFYGLNVVVLPTTSNIEQVWYSFIKLTL